MVEILIYHPSIWVPPTGSQQGNTAIYLRKRLGTKSWLGKQRCIRNASDTPPATEANTRLLLHQRRSERDAFLFPSHNKLLSAGKRTNYKPCLVRSKIMESSLFPTEDSSSGPAFSNSSRNTRSIGPWQKPSSRLIFFRSSAPS